MPGYVIGKHGGIPESYLSHRQRCFFAVSHFLEDSSGGGGGGCPYPFCFRGSQGSGEIHHCQ